MKSMKPLAALLFMATLFTAPSMAQKETKMKEHKCTKACTKDKHVYAHGEKGHVCTAACHKTAKGKM